MLQIILLGISMKYQICHHSMPLIIEKKNIVGDMKTAAAGAARCRET
jgi:hypothetical protein